MKAGEWGSFPKTKTQFTFKGILKGLVLHYGKLSNLKPSEDTLKWEQIQTGHY